MHHELRNFYALHHQFKEFKHQLSLKLELEYLYNYGINPNLTEVYKIYAN